MDEHPTPPPGRRNGTLQPPDAGEQRAVLRQWRQTVSGLAGARGPLPDTPDDPVAHKLLDAAGDAIHRGDLRQGMAILKLVAREFRHSQEAACARLVIDRLAERAGDHGL